MTFFGSIISIIEKILDLPVNFKQLIFNKILNNFLINRKIKHLEKQMLDKCKAQLKVLKNKEEREELQRFINLFEESKNVVHKEIIPETNKVVEEQFIKKVEVKKKEPFVFKTERSRVDYSRYVYWCNPFEPINKGKLGTTQGWRIEKPVKQYY